MKNLTKMIIDVFFPNRCPFCNGFIKWDKLCCDDCEKDLPYTAEEVCLKCGKKPCQCSEEINYDRVYSCCYYKDKAKSSILDLKTTNATNTCEFFGNVLSCKINSDKIKYDYIIPVPMSDEKKKFRGYNQAEELAKVISKKLKIEFSDNFLYKEDSKIEQHSLSIKERNEYVKEIYKLRENVSLKNKKILICDDVLTTGSTANYCSLLLKKAGAEFVGVSIIAVTEKLEQNL